MRPKIATISVVVNIGVGNMWEGNACLTLNIPEEDMRAGKLETEVTLMNLVNEAIEDYIAANDLGMVDDKI